MEKLNLDFKDGSSVVKSICWILSYLSWLLLVVSGWISIKWLDDDLHHIIWTIGVPRDMKPYPYMPFQMHVSLVYIVFILALLVILGGCIIFFTKTIFKPDDQVKTGMMGDFSKFHFFPLLCASALFIIGECVEEDLDNADHWKGMYISGLIFALLGLCSLVFIYIMTDLNTNDWWVQLLLKKGTYSCLIVLMWYYFCYNIYYVHAVDKPDDVKMHDWAKGCGLAFSIIFGIGSLAFSFVFKDLVVSGMNALIYVGLTVFYFKIDKNARKLKECNKNGDGIVDIIMLVLSVCLFAFLLLKYKDECVKS